VKRRPIGVGIIGGGLMGREIASAFARWRALVDVTIEPKLVGVADLNPGRARMVRRWTDVLGNRLPAIAGPE
jgi:3-hydroxyacyl-CoA dehydrogenase